jgi:DNA recombination protein RmuC
MLDFISSLRVGDAQALLMIATCVVLAAVVCGWIYLRLQTIRDLQVGQQQNLLALQAMRTTFEALELRVRELRQQGLTEVAALRESLLERSGTLQHSLSQSLGDQQLNLMRSVQESLHQGFAVVHQQLGETLQRNAADVSLRVEALTRATDERLKEISGQVERRLAEGFEKTTATFADVVQRLALIDEAQKKITALSGDVISLQQILADKRSRGAFGEVQLASLVRNVLPEAAFSLQHALPNGKIADCVLFLPAPNGAIAIDAKFPLEAYRRMTDFAVAEFERKQAERQFKQDIRKHIKDIASRYIIPNVTSEGAMMFIPAEAVFAEIQAHHPALVDEAHAARVWLVSPTTLWAVLNTACAVLKDAATREQVDVIREHIGLLAKDFQRFRERMEQLARHIEQAHEDVQKVNISARRITDRFDRIERVEMDSPVDTSPEAPIGLSESGN